LGYWFLWAAFLKTKEVTRILGLLFSTEKATKLALSKIMGWIHFWAISSKTHLVTLVLTKYHFLTRYIQGKVYFEHFRYD
jgi:hypothetical protein